MHCTACDRLLSDFESTRKNKHTGSFVDLCNQCFKDIKDIVPVVERKDLMTERDFDVDDEDDAYNDCSSERWDIDDFDDFIDADLNQDTNDSWE